MSNKNPPTGWLIKMVFAGILATGSLPSPAHAQSADLSRQLWMATSADEASLAGRDYGRLTIIDGELTYASTDFEWRIALSEIKRIAASKQMANALEVESFAGEFHFVGIVDGQLTMTSPGKAVQAIQRAIRNAPAPPVPARTALAAAGGGQR